MLEIRDFALALLGEIKNTPDIRRSKVRRVSECCLWPTLLFLDENCFRRSQHGRPCD